MWRKRTGVVWRGVFVEFAVDELQTAVDMPELAQVMLGAQRQNLLDVKRDLLLLLSWQRGQIAIVIELHDARQMSPNRVVEQLRRLQVLASGDIVARRTHISRHCFIQTGRKRSDHRAFHAGARARQREQRRYSAPR